MAFNSPKRSMFEQGQVHEQNTLFASPKQCATREGDTVTSVLLVQVTLLHHDGAVG